MLTEKVIFVMEMVENTMGKGENAGYQHFLLFPILFSKGCFLRVVKSRDCGVSELILHHAISSLNVLQRESL